jgi:hypothetical protein
LAITKTSMKIENNSRFSLKVKNGPEYEWNLPNLLMDDLILEKTVIKIIGLINITDSVNKLFARVLFPESSFFTMPKIKLNFWSKSEDKVEKKKDANEFIIKIFKRIMNEKVVFCNGGGNFARYIRFGEEKDEFIYWSHNLNNQASSFVYEKVEENLNILPSSSIKREEFKKIESKEFKEADEALEKLESEYEADEKKRESKRTKKNKFGLF